jgi:hypothetical protein
MLKELIKKNSEKKDPDCYDPVTKTRTRITTVKQKLPLKINLYQKEENLKVE